jgi:hypothetical protein
MGLGIQLPSSLKIPGYRCFQPLNRLNSRTSIMQKPINRIESVFLIDYEFVFACIFFTII